MVPSVDQRGGRGNLAVGPRLRWVVFGAVVIVEPRRIHVISAPWPGGDPHQDPEQWGLL